MKTTLLLAAMTIAAAPFLPSLAHAGEGHDHGDAAPVARGAALPRFPAVSEAFELVGVLNGRQITLYLDRSADNSPVTEALIELEIGGAKLKAEKHEDAFEVVLASRTPVTPLSLPSTSSSVWFHKTSMLPPFALPRSRLIMIFSARNASRR